MLVEASTGGETKSDSLRRIAHLIDQRPYLFLPIWIVAYLAALWRVAHRPLWYDELFTYYVAMSPDWGHFVGDILHVDLNPPLSYFFVRASIALFGDSPFSTRLPSLVGFLIASLILFHVIRRRLGGALGLAALGIFWSSTLTAYAVEARPYALEIAFFSIATWCWLNAIVEKRWTKWHTGLAASIAALLLTHCYSPVFAAALIAAEFVRSIRSREVDRRVWMALLAPLSVLPLYIPLVRNAQSMANPHKFEATLSTIPMFYVRILLPVVPAILVILALWQRTNRNNIKAAWRELIAPHETAFGIAAMAAPIIIICYSIRSGVPFWDRYGIGAVLGASFLLAILLAFTVNRNTIRAASAAALILIVFCLSQAGTGRLMGDFEGASDQFLNVRRELPLVASCGITFLEMDHRLSQNFRDRLYYLTDRQSAFNYAHATAFEGYPILRNWFPIRSNIFAYREFVSQHRDFLVLASSECPLEWLVAKLKDDGAAIRLVYTGKTGYHDRDLYEVTFPQ